MPIQERMREKKSSARIQLFLCYQWVFELIKILHLKKGKMMSQQNQMHSFFSFIKNIYLSLEVLDFEEALTKCQTNNQFTQDQMIQIQSIKAYILMNLSKFQDAENLLENCLQMKPLHLPSMKRKASLLEKVGKIQQARHLLQHIHYLEPESRSLKNRLKKIKMKSHHSSAKSEESSDSKDQEEKKQKPVVKFGSFQVIEITTEDSDEHFALIKEQLNKMSEKKPKKSILKEPMSTGLFSEKKKKNYSEKQEEFEQKKEKVTKEENLWQTQKIEAKSNKSDQEGKKKKKCKSVTFGDNIQYDDVV